MTLSRRASQWARSLRRHASLLLPFLHLVVVGTQRAALLMLGLAAA